MGSVSEKVRYKPKPETLRNATMPKISIRNVIEDGKYYERASERYPHLGGSAAVNCDSCGKEGIDSCVGLGELDVCIPCYMRWVGKSTGAPYAPLVATIDDSGEFKSVAPFKKPKTSSTVSDGAPSISTNMRYNRPQTKMRFNSPATPVMPMSSGDTRMRFNIPPPTFDSEDSSADRPGTRMRFNR